MPKVTVERFNKGKMIDANRARVAIKKSLDTVAKTVKVDYKATMQTWKKQKTEPVIANDGEEARLIYVPNKIFGYVDLGTKAHTIVPKTARRLAFRSGFTAKTSPGVIGSGSGGSSGGFVFSKRVRHPGTKPRLFSKTIAEKRKSDLQKEIDTGLGQL